MQVLMSCPNVLMLDEPTNDLDIETLTILEDYLSEFRGAVVIISHDRYFLDKTCKRIWSFQGNGTILEHTGNFTDYQEFMADKTAADAALRAEKAEKTQKEERALKNNNGNADGKSEAGEKANAPKSDRKKISFNEAHELKTIDSVVSALEVSLEQLEKDIQAASSDFERLTLLLDEKERVETELLEKMERQEYLHSLVSN